MTGEPAPSRPPAGSLRRPSAPAERPLGRIDGPDRRPGGIAPQAAAGVQREALELMVRIFEHHSARERDGARPGPIGGWLRAELGVDADPMAP